MKKIIYDFSNLLRSDKIKSGITNSDITEYCSEINETHKKILEERKADKLGFMIYLIKI